jgi:UDP-N-acetylglucosamine diphosphorylase/glucosamine-1-phosphate N-acetyltransferase
MILVNGRWLPPAGTLPDDTGEHAAWIGQELAYAIVPPGLIRHALRENLEEFLARCARSLPRRSADGALLCRLWELVDNNANQVCLDFERWLSSRGASEYREPAGLVGPRARLWVDKSARLEPMVLADTTRGPVVIDEGAEITAFTRLEGPCYVGKQTHVLGAKIRAGTSIGPGCRVGGEVEASIFQGYVNKYHDGFLGHAYLGEWVNIGAGTQNSDLRNDYGEVLVAENGIPIKTGRNKVGCFIGDHTKTGIGTLLNTGGSIGVFCNLLPCGQYVPRHVPSFCGWSRGHPAENPSLDQLLQTATKVMARRGRLLGAELADLYRAVFAQTAVLRGKYLQVRESAEWRRSA